MRELILAGALLLSGCAAFMPVPPVIVAEAPTYHPAFPEPYSICPITWEVLDSGGDPKVAISYNDNLTAAICDKDKDRYIKQLLQLTCYYRLDLDERICNKETNARTENK